MKKSSWSTAPDHLRSRWAFHNNVGPNTEMWLTPEDAEKVSGRGRGLRGVVTDHKSGKTFKVYGASCGVPRCMCALRTVEKSSGNGGNHELAVLL